MSLTAALTSAVSGLNVAQRALAVTANNVANANTDGYSRKVLNQQALVVSGRGAGVEATDITRITDQFLTDQVRHQSAVAGRSDALQHYQDLLQVAFGAPGDDHDLALQVGDLQSALEDLANDPGTPALGLQVVHAADDLGQSIGALADQVQTLRGDADQTIGRTVDAINTELQGIHDLNVQITRQANLGETSPDLLDRRDALVNQLANQIDIQTSSQDGGSIAIYTASGEALLDATPRVVVYNPAALVVSDTPFQPIAIFRQNQLDPATGQPLDPAAGVQLVSGGIRSTLSAELQNDAVADASQVITSRIRGGQLAGLLETRDSVLPALDDQLQELAAGLRFALNAAHNDGSAVPPPSQLTGTRTDLSDFAGATRSGTATIAVIDRTDGSTQLAFQVDVGAAADETALAAQINASLGAFGSAAIGTDGNLEITLADSGQGLAVAEGRQQHHGRRRRRPQPRLRLRALFRPQRPDGPGRRPPERSRGPCRSQGRPLVAQHGPARRPDLALDGDPRWRRRQPGGPGAGPGAQRRPAGDRPRRPAGKAGQPRHLCGRHHRA